MLRAATKAAAKMPRIGVCQLCSGADKTANLAACRKQVQEAAAAGCAMVCLPECFAFIGSSSAASVDASEPLDGDTLAEYCTLARQHSMWLSLGGFHETAAEAGKIHNSHVIVNAAGHRVAVYRKIHLFDVDVPGGPVLQESKHTLPGREVIVCDSPAGRLGLTTCYDVRFPELTQRLVHEGGADVLLVPSAFTRPTGAAHWHALLRARAIECQAYVVAAAQVGVHNEKRASYGHSVVYSPWGELLCDAGGEEVGLTVVALDFEAMRNVRERMPVRAHREAALAAVRSPLRTL